MVCQAKNNLIRSMGAQGEKNILIALLSRIKSVLSNAWQSAASKAIDESIKGMLRSKTINEGISSLLNRLKTDLYKIINKKNVNKLIKYVSEAYKALKRKALKKLNVGYSFRLIDQRAVKALSLETPYWINNFYDKHLSARIADIGRVTIIEEGIGVVDGAKIMKKNLMREFALRGGSPPLERVVPARYAGNVDEYARILTSNVASRARNFSAMSSYFDAGIERYRIVAVMDRRTSEICIEMNGKEFAVQTGIDHINKMIGATPDMVKTNSPWLSASKAREIAGKGSMAEMSGRLANNGLALPPYHGRCRTLVEAVL